MPFTYPFISNIDGPDITSTSYEQRAKVEYPEILSITEIIKILLEAGSPPPIHHHRYINMEILSGKPRSGTMADSQIKPIRQKSFEHIRSGPTCPQATIVNSGNVYLWNNSGSLYGGYEK